MGAHAGRVFQRGDDRSGTRPQAVGRRVGRVAAGGEHLGAAEHRLGRGAQLRIVKAFVRGDHDQVRLGCPRRAVDDPLAGVGNVAEDGGRADHERL